MFDVDYFKNYNDYYGYQVGDVCLVKVVCVVKRLICILVDLVVCYGGEEFVVVLFFLLLNEVVLVV